MSAMWRIDVRELYVWMQYIWNVVHFLVHCLNQSEGIYVLL